MRLLLLLLATVSFLRGAIAQPQRLQDVTRRPLPQGLADGALVTFYFEHSGKGEKPESVSIDFYDVPAVEFVDVYDISAHLRIDRDFERPVFSNSFIDKAWRQQDVREQPLDEEPRSNAWWRVDVIKLDGYRLAVFFQGFYSGVRTFEKSLNNLQSIYVHSDYVERDSVQIVIRPPNTNLAPLSYAQLMQAYESTTSAAPVVYASFPHFPIGTHIEMAALLRSSGNAKETHARLMLAVAGDTGSPSSDPGIVNIHQKWDHSLETQLLTLSSTSDSRKICSHERPNGDLAHLKLTRVSAEKVQLRVFYKASTGNAGSTCEYKVEDPTRLDRPLQLIGVYGGRPLHLTHSIARSIALKD